jgi:hypothetical protein
MSEGLSTTLTQFSVSISIEVICSTPEILSLNTHMIDRRMESQGRYGMEINVETVTVTITVTVMRISRQPFRLPMMDQIFG